MECLPRSGYAGEYRPCFQQVLELFFHYDKHAARVHVPGKPLEEARLDRAGGQRFIAGALKNGYGTLLLAVRPAGTRHGSGDFVVKWLRRKQIQSTAADAGSADKKDAKCKSDDDDVHDPPGSGRVA
jgi:hypothetical protein